MTLFDIIEKKEEKMEIKNVLSLFDGMSCGQIALDKIGIRPDVYYASEIDKKAIMVTQKNYPNTIQLGSVVDINTDKFQDIDLLIGGSPCQGFSFAGKKKGMATKENVEIKKLDDYLYYKDNGFEFNGQSYLFWEYIRILKDIKPKYFLLENVRMSKKWLHLFNEVIGCQPVFINSNLVSAQNRQRYYWTNIPGDCLDLMGNSIPCQPKDKNIHLRDILEKDYDVLKKYKVNRTPSREIMWSGKCKNITHEKKSSCVVTKQDRWNSQGLIEFEDFCRFLTPLENERLQTVPDNYTLCDGVTDKDRDFMLGNGWTVDVIAHIFNGLK